MRVRVVGFVGQEEGKCVYRYDAGQVSVEALFAALSGIPGVRDLELAREGIETVIAGLYRQWTAATRPEAAV